MSRKLTIGFIGLGGIARIHAQALRELGDKVDFCATVSSSDSRLREFSETYNCKGYMSYIEMLRQESPDIVLISSPHRLHAQIALEAIDAGAHLYIEKPMATSLEEALKIVEAAEKKGTIIAVGHHNRFNPAIYTASKLVAKGFLGKLYHAKGSMLRQRGIPKTPSFTRKELAGGGAVLDLASHVVDTLLYLAQFPRPLAVTAAARNVFGTRLQEFAGNWPPETQIEPGQTSDVEDNASAYITFVDGLTMYIEVSWASYIPQDKTEYTLLGDKAGIHIDKQLHLATPINHQLYTATQPDTPQTNPYREIWKRLLQAANTQDTQALCPATTPQQAAITTAILEKIYQSTAQATKQLEIHIPQGLLEQARNQQKCLEKE
jgi:UDP-N-acetylglucosamine 3-dehydrogenase